MRSLILALLIPAAAAAGRAHAQPTLTADVSIASQYQWRALTTTNRPVFQPDVVVAIPWSGYTISVGTWGNIEAGRYGDPDLHISQNASGGTALTELDLWIEFGGAIGSLALSAGTLGYVFPNASGVTAMANTTELFVKASTATSPTVSAAFWYDVRKVSGAYAETALGHSLGRARLSITAGWNLGQTIGDGDPLGFYARRGFTHADVAASTSALLVGGLTLSPSLHVILAGDATTRVTAPRHGQGAKVWLGGTVSWTRVLGRSHSGTP